ncbi:hypothetical protein QNI16_08730 [Cytophagaceae bacterium YF14B1]|uniref:TerB-C domain-containing protein n=1 Tax=Xanthocytophaga flava TaxID=3048013 RepID=A0AAE3QJL3_9BACT|nr:hypothetical protein [Xanthocytophaga flavus]MDJ1480567.1 hypothetical protein [Xanthocytophaga flavus]
MIHTINPAALNRYANAYAKHTCDTFFSQQDSVSGKDMVSFTDIPQVNYLILFKLFTNWKQEAGRLQSPYFDYSQDEVKSALENLMNTLSRFIMVKQEAFEPLVADAVSATIELLLSPRNQFVSILKYIDFEPLTIQRLQDHTRYIRINRTVWESLIAQLQSTGLESSDVLSLDKAIAVLEDILTSEEITLDDPEEYIAQFSALVPLEVSELEKIEEEKKPEPEKTVSTSGSFFDTLGDDLPVSSQEKVVKPLPKIQPKTEPLPVENKSTETKPIENQPIESKPIITPELPPVALNVIHEVKAEDVKVDIEEFAKAANKPLVSVLSVKKKMEETTLNDTLNKDLTTLNEKLRKEDSTFIEKAQNQPITSIKDALNLNQKYYFINSLFGGDNIAFAQAIYELEQTKDMDTAMKLLQVKYAHSLGWDLQSEEYIAFIDVIERKFIS